MHRQLRLPDATPNPGRPSTAADPIDLRRHRTDRYTRSGHETMRRHLTRDRVVGDNGW